MFIAILCLLVPGVHAIELPPALRLRLHVRANQRRCEFELRRGARPEIQDYDLIKALIPEVAGRDLLETEYPGGGALYLLPIDVSDAVVRLLNRAATKDASPITRVLCESAKAFTCGETPGVALWLGYHLRGQTQQVFVIFPKETYPVGMLVVPRVAHAHTYLNDLGPRFANKGHHATVVPVTLEAL